MLRLRIRNAREKRAPKMTKRLGFTAVVASALTAAFLGLATPASATPAGPGNAQDTISDLQAHGYTVIVNRIGDAPLEEASVIAIRTEQTYTPAALKGPGNDLRVKVPSRTVYVDVK
jgi:hypothetical protein